LGPVRSKSGKAFTSSSQASPRASSRKSRPKSSKALGRGWKAVGWARAARKRAEARARTWRVVLRGDQGAVAVGFWVVSSSEEEEEEVMGMATRGREERRWMFSSPEEDVCRHVLLSPPRARSAFASLPAATDADGATYAARANSASMCSYT
ncbi:MAG: hypothetical protein LQ340_008063, partial [Diploschistes diacapsis]